MELRAENNIHFYGVKMKQKDKFRSIHNSSHISTCKKHIVNDKNTRKRFNIF